MSTLTLDEPLALPPQAEEPRISQPAPETHVASVAVKDVALARLPSLDGWRALSIILVLGAHTVLASGFPKHLTFLFHQLFDGLLGVRFFFVISGLLITWLMLGEEQKMLKVSLPNFYARRALRILPVYMAFLLVAAVLQYYTACDHHLTTWIANLTFTRNFFPGDNTITEHLWSLAVEEQFYLLWPFVFVALPRSARTRIMPFILTGTILVAIVCRCLWMHRMSDSPIERSLFQQWSFFNNIDSLTIGCIASIWLASDSGGLRAFLTSRKLLVFSVGILMILEPKAAFWLADRPWMPSALKEVAWASSFYLGRTTQSAGFVMLVLQSIMLPSWGLYRCLNWRPVAALGVLSYSLYIWQQVFYHNPATFGLTDPWWMSYPLWLVPAFTAAIISYHFLEKPFFKLRHHFR